MLLADWEDAQQELEHGEFLDDRLAQVGEIVAGRAIFGTVTKVDREQFDLDKRGKPTKRRPRIVVEADGDFGLPRGTKLWWSERPSQTGALVEDLTVRGKRSRITLKVVAGVTGPLPEVGDQVMFSPYTREWHSQPYLPPDLPWTHVSADEPAGAGELEEAKSLDEVLASEAVT